MNTLMIQQPHGDPEWSGRMTARDLATLSPLQTHTRQPLREVRSGYGKPVGTRLSVNFSLLAVSRPALNGPLLDECWHCSCWVRFKQSEVRGTL